jgi:hypothetical protein
MKLKCERFKDLLHVSLFMIWFIVQTKSYHHFKHFNGTTCWNCQCYQNSIRMYGYKMWFNGLGYIKTYYSFHMKPNVDL